MSDTFTAVRTPLVERLERDLGAVLLQAGGPLPGYDASKLGN